MRPIVEVHLRDQPEIGRAHLADFELAGGHEVERAVLVIGAGPAAAASISIGKERVLLRLLLAASPRAAGMATSAGSTMRVVGLGRDQRRMRAHEDDMREPRPSARAPAAISGTRRRDRRSRCPRPGNSVGMKR